VRLLLSGMLTKGASVSIVLTYTAVATFGAGWRRDTPAAAASSRSLMVYCSSRRSRSRRARSASLVRLGALFWRLLASVQVSHVQPLVPYPSSASHPIQVCQSTGRCLAFLSSARSSGERQRRRINIR
jgi:hypothetical protein